MKAKKILCPRCKKGFLEVSADAAVVMQLYEVEVGSPDSVSIRAFENGATVTNIFDHDRKIRCGSPNCLWEIGPDHADFDGLSPDHIKELREIDETYKIDESGSEPKEE